MDVYLAPHSDDICFSLGAFAYRRRAGILLTVFPISGYVAPRAGVPRPPPDQVTKIRMAEDRKFAAACGLQAWFLKAPCASAIGHGSFDLGWAEDNARRIETPLIQALMGFAAQGDPGTRSWLMCPSGIGSHVDHVALRLVVTRHFDTLSARYRLSFYEDLHYASDRQARQAGLDQLFQTLGDRKLSRQVLPLGDALEVKLRLLALYPSQFTELPRSIERFTPSVGTDTPPHEALWTTEIPDF